MAGLSALSLWLIACGGNGGVAATAGLVVSDAPRNEPLPGAHAPLATALNALSTDLYAQLAEGDGNLVFSPYSTAIALAMTRAGARGETAEQMDRVLHAEGIDLDSGFNALEQLLASRPGTYELPGGEEATIELRTANTLWGQHDLEFDADFLDALAANYGAGMHTVDYVEDVEGSRLAINEWVSDETRSRIPELVPRGAITTDTRLVLTNAIYLKAQWALPFSEALTTDRPFHRLDGSTVDVPTMQLSSRLHHAIGEGFTALELPYVNGELAMWLLVPDEGGLAETEAQLGAILDELPSDLTSIETRLRMPRFEFRTQAALKPALSELGMPIAFTDAADFSGITSEADLLIQDVVHEAFISVDEEGTEAAAATAVIAGVTSAPLEVLELDLDRPFIFAIVDTESGAPLFLGRVTDPSAN
jgi:serpin B